MPRSVPAEPLAPVAVSRRHRFTLVAATSAKAVTSDDNELLSRIAANDADAFGELYDRYCARAYRVASSICWDTERAEDAVQEAFLSVWRSSSTFESQRGSVAAWLLTIVRYRAIDAARLNGAQELRQTGSERLALVVATEDVAEQTAARSQADEVRSQLADLPDAHREVITLAFFGELSHTEIAAQLDLPLGTVKGRIRLGLDKLRTTLDAA